MTSEARALMDQTDRLLAEGSLEAAEGSCCKAFLLSAADDDTRSEALWALVKLAGKFIALGINDRPAEIYKHIQVAESLERSFVLERLAIFHRQKGNADKAETCYVGAFAAKGQLLGFDHEDAVGAMNRAQQYLQAQGKSLEILADIIAGKPFSISPELAIRFETAEAPAAKPEPQTSNAKFNERNRNTGGFRTIKPLPPKPKPAAAVPIARGVRTRTGQVNIPLPGKVPLSGPSQKVERTASVKPEADPLESALLGAKLASAPKPEERTELQSPDFEVRDEDLRLFTAEVPLVEESDPVELLQDSDSFLDLNDLDELDQTVSGAYILPLLAGIRADSSPIKLPVRDSNVDKPIAQPKSEPADRDSMQDSFDVSTQPRSMSSVDRESIQIAWQECLNILQERTLEHAKRCAVGGVVKGLIEKISCLIEEATAITELSLEKGLAADEWSAQTDSLDWQILESLSSFYGDAQSNDSDQLSYELALTFATLQRTNELGPSHPDTANSLHRLGFLLCTGTGATKYLRGAIAILKLSWLLNHAIYGTNNKHTVENIKSLAMAYADAQRPEADLFFRRALALVESTAEFDETDMIDLWTRYARFCQDRGNYKRAAEAYTSQLALYEACGHDSENLAQTYQELVLCFEQINLPDLAEQYHERLCDIVDRLKHPDYKRELFASKYETAGQYSRAEKLFQQILASSSAAANRDNARNRLIRLYEHSDRHEEASRLKSLVAESSGDRPAPSQVAQPEKCVAYGRVACREGSLDEASMFYSAALVIGSFPPGTGLELARGLRELALAYQKQGKPIVASECCRNAVKVAESHVGFDHAETANCYHSLAILEDAIENPGAISYFSKAYEIRRRVLGREHLDTAESAFELAIRTTGAELWRDKEDLLKLAITARQRAFGLCDSRTSVYLRMLANHYADQDDLGTLHGFASPQFKLYDSVNVRKPGKLASTFQKLDLLRVSNRDDLPAGLSTREKLQFLSSRLDDRKFKCGAIHPDTISTLFKLVDIYEHALEQDDDSVWIDLPAVDHLNIALNLRLFGHLFMEEEDLPRSHRLFSIVLTLTEQVLGSEHPDSALCLLDLATLCAGRNELQLAEILYQKSLEILEARLGVEHLYPAAVANSLAIVLHKQGKMASAEPLYRKALQVVLAKSRHDSPEKQICLKNLEKLSEKI
ncbi:MAG: tetratricopeptide repeat protein [Candidatus Obscuribacterales bacterium]|nr:tetratricopeptide repeat protein [Candidatus Obscuribacterales bacterium]